MKNYLFLILLILLSSCTSEISNPKFPVEENIRPIKKKLSIDVAPHFFDINSDFLFMASTQKDTMIDVFTTPELLYVTSFGIKGEGPEEIQAFPMFCKSFTEDIHIWGYSMVEVRQLHLSKDYKVDFKKKYFLPAYESFNQLHLLNDSILLYNLISSKLSIKKIDLNEREVVDELTFKTEDHHESYFYSNRGILAADKDFFIYAYLFKGQIDIYDAKTFKLLKRLRKKVTEDIIVNDFQNTVYQYIDVKAGSKYFYALYKGAGSENYLIEVYNYNGDPVIKYVIEEKPETIIYDEKNNIIYAYEENDENIILRYDLIDL